MQIQMVDLKGQLNDIAPSILEQLELVMQETAFINGGVVEQFQQELSSYLSVNHVLPCANGTDALQLALMSLDLEPGDEVITVPFTFVATLEVISLLKLNTVLVDVGDDFNMDVTQLESKITDKTKAILPVHLFGQACDMQTINKLARKYDLKVIEDNAQSIGAYEHDSGRFYGGFGDIGCTSFYPSKVLGAYGDAGAVMTNSDYLADKIRSLSNHGQSTKYKYSKIGVNSRMDSFQAVVLLEKLKNLDRYLNNRQLAADYYDAALSEISEIKIPERVHYSSHVFHQYTIQIADGKRDELKEHLATKGIPSMIYYPIPLHLNEAYNSLGYNKGSFPKSEAFSDCVLSLPMHTELNEKQLEFICNPIKTFFKK